MADQEGYYKDQPTFEIEDPLNRWALAFLVFGIVAAVWLTVLFAVWAADLTDKQDTLWTFDQGTWVAFATIVLIATVIGLIFVIVGRMGATQGGGYLAADLEADLETEEEEEEAETTTRTGGTPALGRRDPGLLRGARIDDPFGSDGRMHLAYTIPADGARGVYGDVKIPVDSDVVLNVKTRLTKLKPAKE